MIGFGIGIDAFKHSLTRCFINGIIPNKMMVALSGGVDSICLTYLLTKYREQYDTSLQISAITIDHRYRDGSSDEAKAIGKLVNDWGVDHHIYTLDYGNSSSGNISNFEEVARYKRYEGFQKTCQALGINNLMVAHNFDDQLETYMQRVQQNSTVFGLSGLKYRSMIPLLEPAPFNVEPPIKVLRPLLDYTKQQIIATCQGHEVPWFEDHTNQDIHLTERNLYRYLINDYIPKQLEKTPHSDLKLINRDNLQRCHQQAVELSQYAQRQVGVLKHQLREENAIHIFPKDSIIKISMRQDEINQNGALVLSRFFFETMYPISPSKNYHWSFAKLLNNFIPRLLEFLDSDKSAIKFTYLNVLISIKRVQGKHDNYIHFSLSRQPIIRLNVSEIKLTLTNQDLHKWILFDKRYWLFFKGNYQDINDIEVIPYEPRVHRKLLVDQFGERKLPKKISPGTPLVILNKEYHALPTHDLKPSMIDIEWCLKDNIYDPVNS